MNSPLTRAWLVLIFLTGISMWTGGPSGEAPLGTLGIGAIVVVSGFKAVSILRYFLELERASAGWRVAIYGYVAVLGGIIFAAYAALADLT
jgi:hypothetical protein